MFFQSGKKQVDKVDFVLAGAQKSGTTALHYFLQQHPEIVLPKKQELHFFDNDELSGNEPRYDLLHGSFGPINAEQIAGECTPIYLFWEPSIARIWKYNPGMKLVILLRNPVDRAFSHWNMQRERGIEPLDFLKALREEKARTEAVAPGQLRRFSYVARGFYAQQLARVFSLFPREQVLVIKFDQFRNRQAETLASIFRFLGANPDVKIRTKEKNSMPYTREITREEQDYLLGIFSGGIAELEAMLGWDCSAWKGPTLDA